MKESGKNAGGGWIDVSVPLRTGMVVYPGDPPVVIDRDKDVAKGDAATLSRISTGLHTGTHVDAPLHFFADGIPVDRIPLDRLVGTALVAAIADTRSIGLSEVKALPIDEAGRIVLFRTRNSSLWRLDRFFPDHVFLSADAARYLVEKGVSAVGIDYLSIDGADGLPAHSILLGASIPVIEGLDLSCVSPGLYECVCLPLLIKQAEAAPARVILRAIAGASVAPSPGKA